MKNWKRDIAFYISGQTVSQFGTALVQYAISWYVTLTTQSGILLTVSVLVGFLPTFLLTPFAGVWSDRYNRKKLILLADGGIALTTLILAFVFLRGYHSLSLLFLVSGIRAIGTAIQTPASGALVPQLVPEEKLLRINGIQSTVSSATMIVAPMVSGLLLALASFEMVLFIDVLTAIIGILALLPIRVKAQTIRGEHPATSYLQDIRDGLSYIAHRPFIRWFFLYFAVFYFLVSPAAFMTPLQVVRSFGPEVYRLTAIEVSFFAGMIAGGVLISTWGGFKDKTRTMIFAIIGNGVLSIGLGLIPEFWTYIGCMTLLGATVALFSTPSTTLLQESVPSDYLGRVYGVYGMLFTSMMPLGMLVFGPIGDLIPIEWLLVGTGILIILLGLGMTRHKVLHEEPLGKG